MDKCIECGKENNNIFLCDECTPPMTVEEFRIWQAMVDESAKKDNEESNFI